AGAAGVPGGAPAIAHNAAAVVLGCAAAGLLLRRCVRRFGGVTGDVFGGLAETTCTTVLLVLALGQHAQ
ncbi:adenosylcobinamide-GDP ribazoletransferase, partial [Streptomyces sp. LNU-CPARS28]